MERFLIEEAGMANGGPTSIEFAQFVTRCQNGIHMALYDHRIMAQPYGYTIGPRVITFRFAPLRPTKPMLNAILQMGPTVEINAQLADVMVRQENGAICIDIPNPWAAAVAARDLRGRGLLVPIGTAGGRGDLAVWHDWQATPNLLVQGAPGTGKTWAVMALLWHLGRQNPAFAVRVVVLCQPNKLDDWLPTAGRMPHTWAIVSDPLEGLAATQWAAEQARAARPANAPDVFFVVDDLSAWLGDVDMGPNLERITNMGRKSRIHLIADTHTNNKAGVGGVAVKNITAKLLLSVGDRQTAAAIAGKGSGAEKLGRFGDALYLSDGQSVRVGVAAVWPEDWQRWKSERQPNYRPWLALLEQGGPAEQGTALSTSTSTDADASARGGGADENAYVRPSAGAGAGAGVRVLRLPKRNERRYPAPTPAELALIAELQATLPLPRDRPPTLQEGRLMLAMLHHLDHKTHAIEAIYKFKNPSTAALFDTGLDLAGSEAAQALGDSAPDEQEATA
jgi:hypothetical protein